MSSGLEPASEPAADNGQDTEHAASWNHSGFMQLDDGSLDHFTAAEDRVELDLFDDGESLIAETKHCTQHLHIVKRMQCADEDAVPEFAYPLFPSEQELVDKMRATIENAQSNALQRRNWELESLEVFELRLQAIVQVIHKPASLRPLLCCSSSLPDIAR